MALSRATIIALIFFPAISMATDFIVGDEAGWTVGFDYQTWTANKVFRVGDKLIFKYASGEHNVFQVNGTDFRSCSVPATSQGLTTGNDAIVLESAGRKWFLCGVGDHCQTGQKLFVNVLPFETESPSPSPLSSVSAITVPQLQLQIKARLLLLLLPPCLPNIDGFPGRSLQCFSTNY